MLVLVAAALAAPPVPQLTARGFAVGVAVSAGAAEEPLIDPDCAEGAACSAVRHRGGWGGLLTLQVAPFFTGWVEAGTEEVKAPAAEYSASGMQLGGGFVGNFLPKRELGVLGWADLRYGTSGTEASASAKRWGVNVGAGARFGQPAGQLTSYLGGEVVITGRDTTSTLDGELDVELRPTVPLNVVAGFQLFSEPLAGPGTSAPLLFLSGTGSVGAELGVKLALGAAF